METYTFHDEVRSVIEDFDDEFLGVTSVFVLQISSWIQIVAAICKDERFPGGSEMSGIFLSYPCSYRVFLVIKLPFCLLHFIFYSLINLLVYFML